MWGVHRGVRADPAHDLSASVHRVHLLLSVVFYVNVNIR